MDTLSSMAASVIHYEEPSKFPGIDIDLSLVIGSRPDVQHAFRRMANVTPLLKNVALIDSYNGVVKSITLRLYVLLERENAREERGAKLC